MLEASRGLNASPTKALVGLLARGLTNARKEPLARKEALIEALYEPLARKEHFMTPLASFPSLLFFLFPPPIAWMLAQHVWRCAGFFPPFLYSFSCFFSSIFFSLLLMSEGLRSVCDVLASFARVFFLLLFVFLVCATNA